VTVSIAAKSQYAALGLSFTIKNAMTDRIFKATDKTGVYFNSPMIFINTFCHCAFFLLLDNDISCALHCKNYRFGQTDRTTNTAE
jgi:hypothetical protein